MVAPVRCARLLRTLARTPPKLGSTCARHRLPPLVQEEVEAMIAEIDEDGSGEIDFPEFVAVMSRKVQADYTPSQVNAAFRVFEGSAPPGHIKQSDLIKALTTYGSTRLTDEQAKELVSQLEPDSSGLIAYAEFVSIMMGDGHEAPAPGAAAASAASAAASSH